MTDTPGYVVVVIVLEAPAAGELDAIRDELVGIALERTPPRALVYGLATPPLPTAPRRRADGPQTGG